MKLSFGGHELMMHASGVLYWPDREMLIVSDLHLEKGSSFARRGFFLPPYDSDETLRRLLAVCATLAPKRLVLLGDSFHDEQGYQRLSQDAINLFSELYRFDPVWVVGNHDGAFVPGGFEVHRDFVVDGLTFRHEAEEDGQFEISGHYHPKADIIHKGARVSVRCFVENGQRLVMPSFGAYTGGLAVSHPSIRALFPQGHTLHVLSSTRVISLKGLDT